MLTLVRFLPPVTGLGVGFAGEFSREVGQFISAVAEKGALVPMALSSHSSPSRKVCRLEGQGEAKRAR